MGEWCLDAVLKIKAGSGILDGAALLAQWPCGDYADLEHAGNPTTWQFPTVRALDLRDPGLSLSLQVMIDPTALPTYEDEAWLDSVAIDITYTDSGATLKHVQSCGLVLSTSSLSLSGEG